MYLQINLSSGAMEYLNSLKCKTYRRIIEEKPLSEEDLNRIAQVAKEELKFMVRQKIPLTPPNYTKWFQVFCYIIENNWKIDQEKIFEIYKEFEVQFKENTLTRITFKNILFTVQREVEEIISNIDDYQKNLTKKETEIEKKHEKTEDESTKEILVEILNELRGLKEQNEFFKGKIKLQADKIKKLEDELTETKKEANLDHLTGLLNRRAFDESVNKLIEKYKTSKIPLSFIFIDIDFFKEVNDTYGHTIGDKTLKDVAETLRRYLRNEDIIGRYGGEEFAVVLPNIKLDTALKIADRLRNAIKNRTIKVDDYLIKITASFGVAEIDDSVNSVDDLVKKADLALYSAKKDGRDKIYHIPN